MPALHDNLFGQIANFGALHDAWRKAVKGKRRKPGAARFTANLEKELLRLERELQDRSWRPGRYVEIAIRDPKPRMVSAAPFRDRVVHHALCAVVEPIFERATPAPACASTWRAAPRESHRQVPAAHPAHPRGTPSDPPAAHRLPSA